MGDILSIMFTARGRLGRTQFALLAAVLAGMTTPLFVMAQRIHASFPNAGALAGDKVIGLVALATAFASLNLSRKRLADMGVTGWHAFSPIPVFFVHDYVENSGSPFSVSVQAACYVLLAGWMVFLALAPGQKGQNVFGWRWPASHQAHRKK